jgi:hypothetical protein
MPHNQITSLELGRVQSHPPSSYILQLTVSSTLLLISLAGPENPSGQTTRTLGQIKYPMSQTSCHWRGSATST